MESKKPINVKLLIDTNENRVLFAEASKDFVDFLFFLLSLPIGTVMNLLSGKFMDGCCSISNLYNSFANLTETYLEPKLDKSILLDPKPSISVSKVPLLMGSKSGSSGSGSGSASPAAAESSKAHVIKLYSCSNCRRGTTNMFNGVNCPACNFKGTMTVETHYLSAGTTTPTTTTSSDSSSSSNAASYVKGVISYMISDDLSVTPMSMISSISMMNKFNVTNLSFLQERNVEVGTEEALQLLKASFQSSTVLTHVFLQSKKN